MKKQFLALAAAVVLFAACQNSGSSTVGEKDDEYANTFHHSDSTKAETDNTEVDHH